MNSRIKRILSISLAGMLALSVISIPASAKNEGGDYLSRAEGVDENTYERAVKRELSLSPISNKRVSAYKKLSVMYGSKLVSSSARMINGEVYIGLRAFASAIGGSVTYNANMKTSTMKYRNLTVTVNDGAYVIYANSRPIFALSNSVIMNDGLMYVPLKSIAKTVGLSVNFASNTATLSGSLRPMPQNTPYSSDEVFWLARIIQAESSGESLLGKIGVGTVVMNRVKSASYPNTIYGVIFDKKHGVQFSPILNGAIYNTPNYQSTLAAKICLEGGGISDEALFFLEPNLSSSQWIPNNRKYLFSILHHDFYA